MLAKVGFRLLRLTDYTGKDILISVDGPLEITLWQPGTGWSIAGDNRLADATTSGDGLRQRSKLTAITVLMDIDSMHRTPNFQIVYNQHTFRADSPR